MSDSSYEILCPGCRTPIPSTAEVCPACGHSLHQGSVPALLLDTPARSYAQPAAVTAPAMATPSWRLPAHRYAGFWIRVAAAIVDSVVFVVPVFLLRVTFGRYALLVLLVAWLYYPLMESSESQGTIGKIAFGLKVTDTSCRRISFGRAVARYFAKIPSTLILYLGYVMVGLTAQKRGLHDYIAGTLVLRS
jgi:uncharacterized RDD family membrane protein YckC